jgi:N-acetylglucosamine malate deacetylase 1
MNPLVLVVAPHPDDEALGCGGAICLHCRRGETVRVAFLTSGERGIDGVAPQLARSVREAEAAAAADVLGVTGMDFLRLPDLALSSHVEDGARRLAGVLEATPPGLIYLPHPVEDHPDHQAALPVVVAALARVAARARWPELRAYEVWTPMPRYGWPEDISPVMARKLRAVRCYRSQLHAFRYDRAILGLNRYRGCLAARCRYAEVFRYLEPAEAGGAGPAPGEESGGP